jgi:hypothetical protein
MGIDYAKYLAGIGLALASGCVVPTETAVTGPSGNSMSTARCSQSPQGCLKVAAESCQGPYQVLDSYSKAGGLVADALPGPVTWYYLTFQCGPSDGRLPSFPFRGPRYQQQTVTVFHASI